MPLDQLELAFDQLLVGHIEIGDEDVVLGQLAGELCSMECGGRWRGMER